jgi:transposase
VRVTGKQLRTEYERLARQMADALANPQADGPEYRKLLERLRALTQQCVEKLAEAEAQIAELKRELFGPKADRLTPEQEVQLNTVIDDMKAEAERPAPDSDPVLSEDESPPNRQRPQTPRRRHPMPLHMETETVTIEPDGVGPCPCCGKRPRRIGDEVTEEIDFIPARLIRRRIVRPKYACACGEAGVAVASLPPRLIPHSKLGLGLAVHIVLTRFDDHLSYYRIEQQFRERHGIAIPRQQMVQWMEHIATWLEPLVECMWRRMLATGYLQVDETPVKVLDPEVRGKAARGYLWFYAVPGGDVLLDFDSSRGLEPVRKRLEGFSGTIQTDAYEVYQSLSRRQPGIQRIGCLAHSRRYLYKALQESFADAAWFIAQIRLLYRMEDEIRGLPPDQRFARRQQDAPEIWARMKSKAEQLHPALLPKSTLGKAIGYFLNDYDALTGYLRAGRFEIDNNLIENSIRPTAVGRKRWLFIGHPDAGWRSAVIYSVLVSCRRRGINPQDYLTDILRRLPAAKINEIDSLLPANWKPSLINSG